MRNDNDIVYVEIRESENVNNALFMRVRDFGSCPVDCAMNRLQALLSKPETRVTYVRDDTLSMTYKGAGRREMALFQAHPDVLRPFLVKLLPGMLKRTHLERNEAISLLFALGYINEENIEALDETCTWDDLIAGYELAVVKSHNPDGLTIDQILGL
jgi:hypothetical protein